MKGLIEIGVLVAFGAIVLLAFVLVLRRLARENEPVEPTEVARALSLYERKTCVGGETLDQIVPPASPSWHEQERLRKKHRENERARKKRQKNRKGGRS